MYKLKTHRSYHMISQTEMLFEFLSQAFQLNEINIQLKYRQ
jgi:hypothetical protein